MGKVSPYGVYVLNNNTGFINLGVSHDTTEFAGESYTAIGDTVNTAARLEANAGGGEIYISREVADILGDSAEIEKLPSFIKLKGKGDTVEVLKLLGLDGKKIGKKE